MSTKKYPTSLMALFKNYGMSLIWLLIPIVVVNEVLLDDVTVTNALLAAASGVIGIGLKYLQVKFITKTGFWFDFKGECIWYAIVAIIAFVSIISDLIPFLA